MMFSPNFSPTLAMSQVAIIIPEYFKKLLKLVHFNSQDLLLHWITHYLGHRVIKLEYLRASVAYKFLMV